MDVRGWPIIFPATILYPIQPAPCRPLGQMGAAVSMLQKQPGSINHENLHRNALLLGQFLQFLSQLRRNPQFNVHALNRIGVWAAV